MKGKWWLGVTTAMLSGVALVAAETAVMVDHNLPAYERVGGISGNLSS
ncbi:MAG: phosphate-binding protein, partial [Candidatus Omnitrophica bacterium]|nr:phosphate-binding protein [Candidatus Omnitrophota bacterium]